MVAAGLVCIPADREIERARRFFLLRFRRSISTDCVRERESVPVSLSLRSHI